MYMSASIKITIKNDNKYDKYQIISNLMCCYVAFLRHNYIYLQHFILLDLTKM